MYVDELVRWRLLDWSSSQKAVILPFIVIIICTKEDDTKTISTSRCGSCNGGVWQELCSYLDSAPTREKAEPTSH